MTNEKVERYISDVIKREGGYSNSRNDAGGETMYGITVAVARAEGYAGAMKDMPQEFARKVYRANYWERPGFAAVAKVSPAIAEELFDTGVNMGVAGGVPQQFLQRSLNCLNLGQDGKPFYPDVVVDGDIGAKTIAALTAYLGHRGAEGERVMLTALNCLQGARYVDLTEKRVKNEEFFFGWLRNRVVI